jgi:adenosylcobinamide-GDP ribazoletransferase
MQLAGEWRRLVGAARFLTRLPTPTEAAVAPDGVDRAARYFPVVGQLVGLLCAGVWLAAGRLWPGLPAAALAVGAGVLVTGALHEDGLADTADGLGGGRDREQRLAIMKDSRIGAYGALALILAVTVRIALLAGMTPWAGVLALVVAHGGARAAAVIVMTALPYSGDPRAARIQPPPGEVTWVEAAVALALGAWPLIGLGLARATLAVGLAAAATTGMALAARRLIGGVTGDVLGAVEQLAEVALLMGAAAAIGAP